MTGSILINREQRPIELTDWEPVHAFRCHVAIEKDADDLFSVIVLNLSGAGSSGPNEEVALERTKESVLGLLEYYDENGIDIPWLMPKEYESQIPDNCKLKWILVDGD
ncbi:hypothetical protein [Rubinisphaera italica]|uniref:Uncharacterized protein n=1 Tax=Rubinisphaera italica TaxID=2527969 RepID=A0A5C5XGX1_9PLAN|nr:hypothetical protein [Rubinisphaera italica]TWT62230.1 hypothetical protein Pan54_29710 [Rubinisphaera italica]